VKIIALTNRLSAWGGGIPPAIFGLYEHLAAPGANIVLVASDPPDQAQTIRVITYRTLGPRSFGFSPDLPNILEQECPDIVHLHGLWTYASIAAQIWRRRTGKPIVISPHGMMDPWALRQSAIKKRIAGEVFEWANLRKASCIHALTQGEAQALSDCGFGNHVVKIPNGIELTQHADRRDSSKRILLYLGRLHPKKGIAETIVAWSVLQKESLVGPARWQLVIAGWDDGDQLDKLRQLVKKVDVEQWVKFVGPVFGSAKDALYESADATILASYSEGLPMTVLETWSCGKPAFITEQCNLPEGFEAGAAFKITTDPQVIANVLIATLPDEVQLIRAGRAGRALVERSFNWRKISERWLTLYSSLINAGSDDGRSVANAS
jgi:glycosyltransferase involved in cell wall biosynthesis